MVDHQSQTNNNLPKWPEGGKRRGRLFIVSAPSGAGKTTLCEPLLSRFSDMTRSVSHTTRQPRDGEKHGFDYFFIDEDVFRAGIKDSRWVEWAQVHGHYYGTAADFLEKQLVRGVDVLLNIDVQGARQLFHRFPDSVGIFIMPPSMDKLRTRLQARRKDNPEAIENRLLTASEEMAQKGLYHHIVLNDSLERAINDITGIIETYR